MKQAHLIGVSLFAMVIAAPSVAQTAPQDSVTDSSDIIVTATKREQTLQDVPISVSVTGAETVERAQIRDLIDLQSVVPSLKVSQLNAVGQTNFIIRGFGNGNGNDGIESSVGVFVDGVYRSRSAAALDDLPEIERVEVLRGPQSTLFGKNVSAGAISIVTKKPQFDFGAKAEITYGNYNQMLAKATITGPISETVAIRLSGSVNERDGYFTNLTTGTPVNDRNRWSVRGDILWQPTAEFSFRLIADYNLIKEVCCGVTSISNGANGQPYPTQQVTLADGSRVSPTNFIGSPIALGGLGKPIGDTTRVFDRNVIFNSDPTNRVRGEGISGQADWDIGFAKLTSITAYRDQVNQSFQDIDFTGADISNNKTANDIKTFTQEFRLASTGNGPLSWLVGGFYQDEKTDTGRQIRYGSDARAYLNGLTAGLLPLIEGLQAASGNPGQTYLAAGQGIDDNYRLKQRAYSLFGQADFKITPRLTISGGLAYLNDRKEVTSDVVLTDQFSALNVDNIPNIGFIPYAALPAGVKTVLAFKGYNPAANGGFIPTNLFGASFGASLPGAIGPNPFGLPVSPAGTNPFALNAAQFFYADPTGSTTLVHGPVNIPNANESGIFSGDKFTYTGRVAYDFGFINAYVSYSTGWKASAVNLSSDSRPPDVNGVGRFAAPENVEVYEAGLKAKFRGGYFNLAVFKESIKGFQSNGFTGTGYALVNAGQESVRGFEIDSAYRPLPFLALTGAVTYLDPKYDSFTKAPCFVFDTARCPINPLTGLPPAFRDLTGDKPAGVPEWSVSTSATISHDFGGGINAYLRGEYDYTSNTYLTETTPQSISTWGLSQINASLSLVATNAGLEVTVWGRNITNDNSLIATFSTVAQSGSYSGYPNQPRTYGVTVRKTF